MSKNLSKLLEIGFEPVGYFSTNDGKLNFYLSNHKNQTGCYSFVIDKKACYVGVTKNTLYARMNGYKNPGPSQQTNKRINPQIKEASQVEIYFLPESEITRFEITIERNDFKKEMLMDMTIFERFLISLFRPDWNRE